jgi:hypothetical protein
MEIASLPFSNTDRAAIRCLCFFICSIWVFLIKLYDFVIFILYLANRILIEEEDVHEEIASGFAYGFRRLFVERLCGG